MTERELRATLTREARWLQTLRERIEQLRGGFKSANPGSDRVQSSNVSSQTEDAACEIVRLEGEIDAGCRALHTTYFSLLEDERQLRVMEQRYIRWHPWYMVAAVTGYSESHAKRLHSEAMILLSKKVSTFPYPLA
jgi:hypothetical protein